MLQADNIIVMMKSIRHVIAAAASQCTSSCLCVKTRFESIVP